MSPTQLSLLQPEKPGPEGFAYQPDLISPAEEQELLVAFRDLPFQEFEFQGYRGKRRVVSYGLRYDFNDGKLRQAEAIPGFLRPLRERAAGFAGIAASDLAQALVTEYAPGAGIGWHKDRSVFADVIGISLVSPCRFRLRRKASAGWERVTLAIEPRSAYLLRGEARAVWEHSIPPMESLRYSVTFRSMKAGPASA
ncbi:alpha-ketoglutarate-dependent dioxygenase AlkB [Chelatococcus sp. GCM10030263]|uniref:alpha-ketoglutarate-dependent dioxygenase AlkB n=1 Tax=Chelatococcus sp. GCM10030263 TaxID=3273387 RepID=UPI0036158C26